MMGVKNMRKVKYISFGVIIVLLVLSLTGSLGRTIIVENPPCSTGGPELEVTTDKRFYLQGEPVAIYLTNVGDEVLSAGGPIVTIYNRENEIVYHEGCYCWWELEPGEYIEWPPWDQTDQYNQQVPFGRYVVEGFLSGYEQDFIDTATFYIIRRPLTHINCLEIP
jgi:hypothetical protein